MVPDVPPLLLDDEEPPPPDDALLPPDDALFPPEDEPPLLVEELDVDEPPVLVEEVEVPPVEVELPPVEVEVPPVEVELPLLDVEEPPVLEEELLEELPFPLLPPDDALPLLEDEPPVLEEVLPPVLDVELPPVDEELSLLDDVLFDRAVAVSFNRNDSVPPTFATPITVAQATNAASRPYSTAAAPRRSVSRNRNRALIKVLRPVPFAGGITCDNQEMFNPALLREPRLCTPVVGTIDRREGAMTINSATARFEGFGKEGRGHVRTRSGALDEPYGFASRFEGQPGTNPEEMIAAAHASCFTMAASFALARAGYREGSLETECEVTLEKDGEGFSVTKSALSLRAQIRGIGEKEFAVLVDDAKANCPISKLLRCEITLEKTLEN